MPALCHHCASFSRPIAYIRRSLWRPMCLHSAARATLEPIWRCFSLHSASFARLVVPVQQFWWPKERTRVVLQQLHRNGTFYILNIISQSERWFCLPCITIVPLLADQWRPMGHHCGDNCASIRRPRRPLSHHSNDSDSDFTLVPFEWTIVPQQQCLWFKEGARVVL